MDTYTRCRQLLMDDIGGLPKTDGSHVVSFASVRGDTFLDVRKSYGSPCMGVLNNNPGTHWSPSGFVIFSRPRCPIEAATDYLRVLIGCDSPWRRLVTAQPEQDLEFVLKYGYILTSLDFPANFVVNFLTAFRLPEEKPWLTSLISRLMKDGVTFGAAAITGTMVGSYNEVTGVCTPYGDSWHYAFDGHNIAKDTVDRINTGNPDSTRFNQSFMKNTSYTPCNIIWGHGNDVKNQFREVYTRNSKSSQLRRTFPDPVPPSSTMTYEGVLAFCKALDGKSIPLQN